MQQQIRIGGIQYLSGAAAEVYVCRWQQEGLRTKELEQKLREKNQRAVEAGQINSEGVAVVHVTYQAFDSSHMPTKKLVSYINEHVDMVSSSAKPPASLSKNTLPPASHEGSSSEPALELSSRKNNLAAMIIGQLPAPEIDHLHFVRAVPRWHFHLQGTLSASACQSCHYEFYPCLRQCLDNR